MNGFDWDTFFAEHPHPTTGDRWERITVINESSIIVRSWDQTMNQGTVMTPNLLERMYSWLSSRKSFAKTRFPTGYHVSWDRFTDAVEGRGGFTPEADILECVADPCNLSFAEAEFTGLFLRGGTVAPTVTPAADLLDSFGFPAVTADAVGNGLERPVPVGVSAWAHGWDSPRSPWLWLLGGTGAGKTCAAAWACVEVAQAAQRSWRPLPSIRFLHASSLADLVDGASLYGAETFANRAQPFIDVDLLVLDDIGVEPRKERYFEAYARIIGGRSDAMRSTITTTQFGLREWLVRFGTAIDAHARSRLASRIVFALGGYEREQAAQMERVQANVIRFDGDDLRNQVGDVA